MEIVFKNEYGHYKVFVNGEFECTCDISEYNSVLNEIKNKRLGQMLIYDIKVI